MRKNYKGKNNEEVDIKGIIEERIIFFKLKL